MTANTAVTEIDPKLAEALRRWSDYASESAQGLQELGEAFTPVKDALQIGQQIVTSMQRINWTPVDNNWTNPTALTAAYRDLADIQLAALDRGSDCYIRFLTTTLGAGKQLAGALRGVSSPQQLLAAYLGSSLDILQQYQADAEEQAATLNQIQSACNAWLQRMLEGGGAQGPGQAAA
ncbi:hypothetical protein ACFPTX_06870 [Pseudomonas sp. GCM10022188]|uniref:hypothetical protein n=1 Tax=Pseudomonas TaxID=286 RepID=UPI001E33C9A8|nr:hypothetical protein [Pseudomonas oryzagri]MCC6075628.1 hypothetical protein [Pseudomonas oryzagri]